jgi:NADH-quinone oxidoreductase subunit M
VSFENILEHGLILLPLLGAGIAAALGPKRGDAVRAVCVVVTSGCIVMAAILAWNFAALERTGVQPLDKLAGRFAFAPEFVPGSTAEHPHKTDWDLLPLGAGSVQFFLGVDGLNIWLVVLTAVLSLPCVLSSFVHVSERVNEFYAWLLALQTCVFGVFLSFDIVLFYVFFELGLIPLFFLIGIWGGPERRYAARKFFAYTLTGGLLTFLGVMLIVIACHSQTQVMTFSIPHLVQIVQNEVSKPNADLAYWSNIQLVVFVLLTAGFAIKTPLIPFHTWLPLAHVEAPTAGSVDLAGIMLKIGAYGFLRLCIPLAPDASVSFGLPFITTLAAIGIVYGAWCAYSQDDIKKLVAYSSVSHLGTCMIGMFSLTAAGIAGCVMVMVNHGLSTAALFLLVGAIYERYHTRKLADYSGMAKRLPYFGFFMVFIALTSVGLPGLNGFVGEALSLLGIMEQETRHGSGVPILTVVAATGMIFGAWYMMTMIRRLLFGATKEPAHHGPPILDLRFREWAMLTPIALLCVALGVYPQPVLDSVRPDVERVVHMTDLARQRVAPIAAIQSAQARQ